MSTVHCYTVYKITGQVKSHDTQVSFFSGGQDQVGELKNEMVQMLLFFKAEPFSHSPHQMLILAYFALYHFGLYQLLKT